MKRITPWWTLLTTYLSSFRELISWKTALLIAEQFSGRMWEKLNPQVNLKDQFMFIFSVRVLAKHGMHENKF